VRRSFLVIVVAIISVAAQDRPSPVSRTPWGDPDLQGVASRNVAEVLFQRPTVLGEAAVPNDRGGAVGDRDPGTVRKILVPSIDAFHAACQARCFPWTDTHGIEIVQAPGVVVVRTEMIHEARIIPLDGRPHPSKKIRGYRATRMAGGTATRSSWSLSAGRAAER
jgi:hypothetical protein